MKITVTTPEQFLAEMENLRAAFPDPPYTEWAHQPMDDLLCRVLCELGYQDGVKVFMEQDKWYWRS